MRITSAAASGHNASSSAAAAQEVVAVAQSAEVTPMVTTAEDNPLRDLQKVVHDNFAEFNMLLKRKIIFEEKDVRLGKPIGGGGSADIFEASLVENNERIAAKVFKTCKTCKTCDRNSLRDARLMIALQQRGSQHIVNVKGVALIRQQQQLRLAMFMEIAPKSLNKHLTDIYKNQEQLSAANAVSYALQIASALCDIHEDIKSESFLHLDVKEANILFFENTNTVKLCDFGIARKIRNRVAQQEEKVPLSKIQESDFCSTSDQQTQDPLKQEVSAIGRGTAPYMPKEQMTSKNVHPTYDIFAFGCILFNLIMGKASYDLLLPKEEFDKLTRQKAIDACLNAHDKMRITIDEKMRKIKKMSSATSASNSSSASASPSPDLDLIPMFLLLACKSCLDASPEKRPQDGKALLIESLLKPCMADKQWRNDNVAQTMAKKYKDLLSSSEFSELQYAHMHELISQSSGIINAFTPAFFPAGGNAVRGVAPPPHAIAAAAAMPHQPPM